MEITTWTFISFLIIGFSLIVKVVQPMRRGLKLPPGPLTWPLVGALPLLGPLPHRTLENLAKKHGPLMFLRLGMTPAVFASSAQMAKEVFQTHDSKLCNKKQFIVAKYFGHEYKDLGFSPYSPFVRMVRKILATELFCRSRLDTYKASRKTVLLSMIQGFLNDCSKDELIVPRSRLECFATNIITDMLYGKAAYGSTIEEKIDEEFAEIVNQAFRLMGAFNMSDFIPALKWLDLQGIERRCKRIMPRVTKFLSAILKEHRFKKESDNVAETFVDVLLALKEKQGLSDTNIIALVFDMVLGGAEPPWMIVEWALAELVRSPKLMEKVQEEIDIVVGEGRTIEENDLSSLPLFCAVVKETLRLHPIAPLTYPRESKEAIIIDGYDIPAEACVYVNLWAVARDPEVWEEPLEFKPERFLQKDISVFGSNFNFLPFGSGRRGCPGAALGLLMAQHALAMLVHCFNWSLPSGQLPEDMDMEEIYGLTCPLRTPLLARASPRSKTSANYYVY